MKTWILLGGLLLAGLLAFLLFSAPADPGPAVADPAAAGAADPAAAGGVAEAAPGAALREEVREIGGSTIPGAGGSGVGRWSFEGPAALVRARLVDPAGKPAQGAEARKATSGGPEHWPMDAEGRPPEKPVPEPPLAAGPDGRIELTVPAGKSLNLEFGGEYWRAQSRRIQPLRPDEVADLGEIALTPAALLAGRTLDRQGKPLAGVRTRLHAADAGMFWEGHALLQSAVSDAQGVVRFPGVPPGRFRVEGEAVGYETSRIEAVTVASAPAEVPFELRLGPGGRIAGRVVDADRRPVADAEVFLFRGENGMVYWPGYSPPMPDREPDARSGADGSFSLQGLPLDGKPVMLGARAEGQVDGYAKDVRAGAPELTIVMPRALTASGRVVGAGDAPIAGARVRLMRKSQWGWDEEKAAATTAADGTFLLEGLAPGECQIHAAADGAEAEPIALQLESAQENLLLRVARQPALRVLVTGADGKPLAGSVVAASQPQQDPNLGNAVTIGSEGEIAYHYGGSGWAHTATAGEDGVAVFRGAPAGELRLQARHEGWARSDLSYDYPGGEAETVVALERPAQLLVRATDGAGGAVRGVGVRLRDPASGRELEEQRTDHLGRAYWPDLRPGAWEILHGGSQGGPDAGWSGDFVFLDGSAGAEEKPPEVGERVELVAGTCVEKEIVLRALAVVTVRVLRNGAPAPDVFARLEKVQEEGATFWGGMHGGGPSGLATDGRGIVVLDPVPAGKYELIVRPSRSAPETRIEADLTPGPQTLTAQLNGAEVRGALRGSGGPVVGARLSLEAWSPEGEEPRRQRGMVISMISADGGAGFEFSEGNEGGVTASSDQNGEYVFQDVPEGRWVVKSRAKGYSPWTSLPFSVAGDRSVRLPEQLLLPGGELRGRDHNWKARPEGAAFGLNWDETIRLEDAAGRMKGIAQPADGGEFVFADLADGEYVLRRGEWKSEPIRIQAGERRRMDVPVAKAEE